MRRDGHHGRVVYDQKRKKRVHDCRIGMRASRSRECHTHQVSPFAIDLLTDHLPSELPSCACCTQIISPYAYFNRGERPFKFGK